MFDDHLHPYHDKREGGRERERETYSLDVREKSVFFHDTHKTIFALLLQTYFSGRESEREGGRKSDLSFNLCTLGVKTTNALEFITYVSYIFFCIVHRFYPECHRCGRPVVKYFKQTIQTIQTSREREREREGEQIF